MATRINVELTLIDEEGGASAIGGKCLKIIARQVKDGNTHGHGEIFHPEYGVPEARWIYTVRPMLEEGQYTDGAGNTVDVDEDGMVSGVTNAAGQVTLTEITLEDAPIEAIEWFRDHGGIRTGTPIHQQPVLLEFEHEGKDYVIRGEQHGPTRALFEGNTFLQWVNHPGDPDDPDLAIAVAKSVLDRIADNKERIAAAKKAQEEAKRKAEGDS
jgi:hypothetical protein